MTEREFERRLRDFYLEEASAGGPMPEGLRNLILDISDPAPQAHGLLGTRRSVVLLAAAMLTILLIGGAIAIGAGLLRLPGVPEDREMLLTQVSDERLGPSPCDQTLADGLSLWVQVSDGTSAPQQVLAYSDGLVLRGPAFWVPEEAQPWEQRRLTEEGMEGLLAAVATSGLRDCVDVPVPGSQLEVKALTAGGVVALSIGAGWFRAPSQAEADAAVALSDRLLDRNLGVAAVDWVDAEWRPYELERWEVRVSFWEGSEVAFAGAERMAWRDLVLPGGETPMDYGVPIQVNPDLIFDSERCQLLRRTEFEEFVEFLDGVADGVWQFRDATGGVAFNPQWILPHRPGCEPSLEPSPPVARGNLIEGLEVCDYLPEDAIAELVAEPWSPFEFQSETHGDGGWAACEYWQGWIFASRHRTSTEDALAIVETQLGPGYSTDEIAGHPVFFNACLDAGVECTPAIAVSVEPHLVIIVPSEGDGSMLRSLATALIERLNSQR